MPATNIYWWSELIACAYLCGLILIIHFIHYPSFAVIKDHEFKTFSVKHARTITPIVLPAMAIELGLAVWLVMKETSLPSELSLVSVLAIWIVTALKSAQTHAAFAKWGFQLSRHRELMKWNRVRCLLWCLRFVGISFLLFKEQMR